MSGSKYKKRILNVLEIEKVSYQMEIARRIDVLKDRTIKYVLKELVKDGEICESKQTSITNRIKMMFYWLPETDKTTIRLAMDFKSMLLRFHMDYSNVQQNFGPKIAIASLRELALKKILPLKVLTIRGPIRKWYGPLGTWKDNEVSVPSGDIDVIALESNNILWIGEVKMRGDYIKLHQIRHFLITIKNFRDKIYQEKNVYYKLKPFFIAPLFSRSGEKICIENNISMIVTKKIYYPKNKAGKSIESFYEIYKRNMGLPNLEIIDDSQIPIPIISMELQKRPFKNTI